MAAIAAARRPRRVRLPIGRILLLGFWLLFTLAPLYWVFVTSIKPSDDFLAVPPVWFPDEPTIVHYTAALFAYRGLDGLTNSLIISVSATILSALLGTLMAYSLARFKTGGKHLAFWVLSQRFLPPIAVILPIFLIYRTLRINDTHFGLIIAYTVLTLPVSVWMMYAYFQQMPKSMEEAALVDGCTRWQAFWSVAVPLAAPGIVAASVFAVHHVLDGVLLRADPDEPRGVHAANRVPRLHRLPGGAIWRGERACHCIAGAVHRAGSFGAEAPGEGSDHGRRARLRGKRRDGGRKDYRPP
jgi:multiple sugar transport system permease protein